MIIIDDSFLENKKIINIQNELNKNNKNLFWEEIKSTNNVKNYPMLKDNYFKIIDEPQDVNVGFFRENSFSSVYNFGLEILNFFALKNNIEIFKLLRIKSNILYKTKNTNSIHPPHIDMDIKHFVLLYYVNDSDGDTFIFNEKFNDLNFNDLTIKKQISPKAGRGVLFDGLNYHSSSAPKLSDNRIVININFIGKIK
jgi:hypothetical protein